MPDDRHALGVVGDMSVWKNAIIERVGTSRFSRCGFIRRNSAMMYAQELVKRYDIRGAALERRARLLSGGNLQKLILGRNLTRHRASLLQTSQQGASTKVPLRKCTPSFLRPNVAAQASS